VKSARAALVALTLLNFLNYLDRQAVSSLFPAIQKDLNLSYAQLGALSTACLVVLSLASVPFGWLADRVGERGVVSGGVLGWCMGAIGAARARVFPVLVSSRALVGLGEAAYEPAANAFICNQLAPDSKAKALAIFNVGTVLGLAMGVTGAGLFARHVGWRHTLFIFGAAGIPFVFVALTLPKRGALQGFTPKAAPKQHQSMHFGDLLRSRAFVWALLGGVSASFAAGAMFNFSISFAVAYHGYTMSEAGIRIGGVTIGFALLGVLTGGVVSDKMDRWRPRGEGRALSIGLPIFCASVPAAICIASQSRAGFFIGAAFTMFFGGFFNAPSAALIDELAPPGLAAAAQGVFLLAVHLFGDGPAPWIVGKIADHWSLRTGLLVPSIFLALAGLCYFQVSRSVHRRGATPAVAPPPVEVAVADSE
jgi:MFS family permease